MSSQFLIETFMLHEYRAIPMIAECMEWCTLNITTHIDFNFFNISGRFTRLIHTMLAISQSLCISGVNQSGCFFFSSMTKLKLEAMNINKT